MFPKSCGNSKADRQAGRVVWMAIRKVTLLPKPTGAIARMSEIEGGDTGVRPLCSAERQALRHIAATADLLDVGRSSEAPAGWLLIPATPQLLDALAQFEDDLSDDLGVDDGREPDWDKEPTVVGAAQWGMTGIGDRVPNPFLPELQERYYINVTARREQGRADKGGAK